MSDDITRKSLAFMIQTEKMTSKLLIDAISEFLKKEGHSLSKGKQSLSKLTSSGNKLSNIEVTEKNIGDFQKVARKYSVDYALKKDPNESPPKYYVFFKANDAKTLKRAFSEYAQKEIPQKKTEFTMEKIQQMQKEVAKESQKTREKAKSQEKGEKELEI